MNEDDGLSKQGYDHGLFTVVVIGL